MLIENQFVDVKITKKNIDYYIDRGYENAELKSIIKVLASDLTKGSHCKVNVKCDYCGDIVQVVYKDYYNYKDKKYACVHCRQTKTSEKNLLERRKILYSKALEFCNCEGYQLITPMENIKTSDSRVDYICPKHGKHNTKIYTLITKHRCIDCTNEENHINSRNDIKKVQDTIIMYGSYLLNAEDYINSMCKNLKVICPECGEIFTTSYYAFTHRGGQLCPKCSQNISRGEFAIKKYLQDKNIHFDMQHRFDDCRTKVPLPFDFYIPDLNTCIEYDGAGHYKPIPRGGATELEAKEDLNSIKQRDKIKTNYCNNHNINLIRIPYWDYDNINNILDNELFT